MTTAGKRERNKEANRAAILAAARRCFIDTGYDAVTIRDIVRATSLASGTFYNYFPDKETLFRALVDARLGHLQERIHASRQHAGSIEDFFYGAYLEGLQEVRNDPAFFAMMFRNEPVLRALYHDNIFGLMLRSLKDDLRAAIMRGVFAETDIDVLTSISFGAGYELCRLMANEPERKPEVLARYVTRLFVDGIAGLPRAAETPMIRIGPRKLRGAAR
ncbi:TetR/AcrR family transcriptional regulator [Solimonas marina]|uniref:TetR/AcrR family transcriptional regulator n=1 Tax=Solimonas marina TaxID=2714601 RepID=A0A969WEM3_9GAMM|nr:TetR/AcrR family transcriptional regulator [Solimonas marina]NKF23340.1 TetR/AcrR family transcriptional regulator [Solimonas marina]